MTNNISFGRIGLPNAVHTSAIRGSIPVKTQELAFSGGLLFSLVKLAHSWWSKWYFIADRFISVLISRYTSDRYLKTTVCHSINSALGPTLTHSWSSNPSYLTLDASHSVLIVWQRDEQPNMPKFLEENLFSSLKLCQSILYRYRLVVPCRCYFCTWR